MKKAIHPPLGAKRHCPRALRIVLLFVILGTFLMLASSCAGTAVSKVTITDWVPKNTPTSSLTVTYRFSNLGSKTITSYWICFEITFAGGGKQQYVHHATETIEGNTIVWPLTAEISLGGTYTVTDVVKLNHGVTTG